ncbi:hypothetical protein BJV82DRAFT_575008 [Fennellomyces sp. T-0311]|nr:hypothetical protein BJV82DRAFT_575008 [Fennellomyces sp. T-0311]
MGTRERRSTIEEWRRDIISKVYMMGEIFDCDISLMISPRNPEDRHAEVATATTGMLIGSYNSVKDKEREEQEAQEVPGVSDGEGHKRNREIDQATGIKVQRLKWGGYRRMKYHDTHNNEKYGYRDAKKGAGLLGYDFGTPRLSHPVN